MANEYLKRTPTSTGNRKVFTWSGWIKLNEPSVSGTNGDRCLFSATDPVTNGDDDDFRIVRSGVPNGSQSFYWNSSEYGVGGEETIYTNTVVRDVSSWQHVILVKDSTQTTSQDRVKIYVNGVKQQISEADAVTQNADRGINSLIEHNIGEHVGQNRHFHGEMCDVFFIDGQALTPDVFGFYKDGDGYISVGSTRATDFRPGQWVPKTPRIIKAQIERNGGFGVNGYYLPMNDSSNFGADFHTTPNSIITLKGEDLPQPKNGAPTTTDAYVSQLRTDPYAANLVLAVPGILGAPGVAYTDFSANIKGSGTNKVITANGDAGVAVTASYYGSALSFDGSGDFFSMPDNDDFNFGSGDFTVEAWIKTDTPNGKTSHVVLNQSISAAGSDSAFYFGAGVDGTSLYLSTSGTSWTDNLTSDVGISTVGWVHQVWQRRGTYLELYTNGVAVGIKTNFSGTVYNSTRDVQIGVQGAAGSSDFEGYIQDFRVYKGVAKYKGGFDVPKPYTPVGIATWRAVPDTTANNFATLNALNNGYTLSNGNLTFTNGATNKSSYSTIGVSTGKWYAEVNWSTAGATALFGISKESGIGTASEKYVGELDFTWGYGDTGRLYNNNNHTPYGDTIVTNDIISIALNLDDQELTFYRNGSSLGVALSESTGLSTDVYLIGATSYNSTGNMNFGQNPTFSGNVAAAGTFTDGNGKGLFKYEPPSGFLALCEDNLPTPAIKNPGEYFKTVLYTGDDNSGRSIVGVGFTPDLVWIKSRSNATNHYLYDSIRGAGNQLLSSDTNVEVFVSDRFNSFQSSGFSLGSSNEVNGSTRTYAAWCWQAGAGTTSTNTDGSINSVVSVNQDAGFSIVSYTGDGNSGATIGHGLDGKTPGFIIVKNREAEENWQVGHKSLGWTKRLFLDIPAAEQQPSSAWNDTAPTSSVITLGNGNLANQSSKKHIAYCWAEVEGFSKFGSYIGNGNADGPFVYCGFKPAWVIIKWATGSDEWFTCDSSRSPVNPITNRLDPSANIAEITTFTSMDFLSNGFKIRTDNGQVNTSGGTFIFAAWAESPFQTANAK